MSDVLTMPKKVLSASTAIPPSAMTDPLKQMYAQLPEADRKALASIEANIQSQPENSRIYWIKPLMAQILLTKYNIDNRPEKPKKIGVYAADMSAMEWRLTGDTVKFSDRGLLRDGQNRLRACVESGEPFQTHVVFGIDDSFFSKMDQGRNRDGSDLLAIADPKLGNTSIVAAAVRWAYLYETDTVMARTTLAPPEVLNLYQTKYQGITAFVPMARLVYKHFRWPAGFITGTLYHLSKIDNAAAVAFGKALAGNQFSGRYLPLDRMKDALAGTAGPAGRIHDTHRSALMIIAWNLVRTGKKGRKNDFIWDGKVFPKPI